MAAAPSIHQTFADLAQDERFDDVDMSLTRARVADGPGTYLIRLTLPELARLQLLSDLREFADAHGLEGVMETNGGVALVPNP